MKKHIFNVKYSGNAKRFQGICQQIAAHSKREAVEIYYGIVLNENYFPEDNINWGSKIRDCNNELIAEEDDDTIVYDGGWFYAEQFTTV